MPTLNISLDTSKYRTPTQKDVLAAKEYVLQREEAATSLSSKIDALLMIAVEKIVQICYKYNVDPQLLIFDYDFNEDMMEEIAAVMDELEDEILDMLRDEATSCTKNPKRINWLIAWMALLGKNKRNLRQTLHIYLQKFMKDIEAAVAAVKYAEYDLSRAVTTIKTHLHTIYTIPAVYAAFKISDQFKATYILSKGVQQGAVGLSNNGSTNVVNMCRTTLQMVWMKNTETLTQTNEETDEEEVLPDNPFTQEEEVLVGYYVARGSNFPCQVCDDACGFYLLQQYRGVLPVHPHCQCYAIPIYELKTT